MKRTATRALLILLAVGASVCGSPKAPLPAKAPPDPAASAVAAVAAVPPWTCAPTDHPLFVVPAGRARALATTEPGPLWDALGAIVGVAPPADRGDLVPGQREPLNWPFAAYYFSQSGSALVLVPGSVAEAEKSRQAEIRDLVAYLETRRPLPERIHLLGYRVVAAAPQPQLEVLSDECQLVRGAETAPSRANAEMAMFGRRLAELGGLTGAYITDKGELVLVGPPRAVDSPPALTLDDIGRAYSAVFNQCECPKEPDGLEGHTCDGAFVSIDPAPQDPFGPAHVVLAPCLRDSRLGNVFTQADVLIKELATGYELSSGDPLPMPPGHRPEAAFSVEDAATQLQAVWTRYWLYADKHSSDSYLQVSGREDGYRRLDASRFHLSLGIEITDDRDRILSTDEEGASGRLKGLPANRFAEQVNRSWLDRYQSYYPVLRQLDNAARLIQVMGWLQKYHHDSQREAFFASLPRQFEATRRTIPLRAGATIAVADDGEQRRSIPFLTYGGVVGRSLIGEGVAEANVVAVRVLPRTLTTEVRTLAYAETPTLSRIPATVAPRVRTTIGIRGVKGSLNSTLEEAASPAALFERAQPPLAEAEAVMPPASSFREVQVPVLGDGARITRGPPSIGADPAKLLTQKPKPLIGILSERSAQPVQPPIVLPRGMSLPRPAPVSGLGLRPVSGRLIALVDDSGATTASTAAASADNSMAPFVSEGVRETATLPQRVAPVVVDRLPGGRLPVGAITQPLTAAANGAPWPDDHSATLTESEAAELEGSALRFGAKGKGGVLVLPRLDSARASDGAELMAGLATHKLFGLLVPELASAPADAAILLDPTERRDDGDTRRLHTLTVRVDAAADLFYVGNLRLPGKRLTQFLAAAGHPESEDYRRWQQLQPAEPQPIFIAGGEPLGDSVTTARTLLTLRPGKPVLIAVRDSGALDELYERLVHPPAVHLGNGQVRAVRIPLYQLAGRATEPTDGWRTVDAAAAVPPGLGVVAVDGDDPAAEQQIVRLGLLGRLTGKTLLVLVSADARTPDRALRGLLAGELVDNAVIGSSASTRALRQAIHQAVSAGLPVLGSLAAAARDTAPVMIVGGR